MYDIDSGADHGYYPDMIMAPYWSRETMDYCYSLQVEELVRVYGTELYHLTAKERQLPLTLVDDTTWYAIDSPIKVMPNRSKWIPINNGD